MGIKIINGYCPIQNKNSSISITVVPTPSFDDLNDFEYGTFECSYTRLNECELVNNCPLRNSVK